MVSRTDDEELAVIKDWWQRNGMPLLTGVALALVVVFGWQGWQKYQANQSQGASLVYQQLLEAALDRLRAAGAKIDRARPSPEF